VTGKLDRITVTVQKIEIFQSNRTAVDSEHGRNSKAATLTNVIPRFCPDWVFLTEKKAILTKQCLFILMKDSGKQEKRLRHG